ncbi:hypothetical protein WJX75_002775 [Coccomyxa subellipsoidea]|uniref:MATH domain-containing protein n=1 Tax=Coccomyxa subellipsoidea TaxID=248742 RepID=A0ABR2Z3Z4_9CHLO
MGFSKSNVTETPEYTSYIPNYAWELHATHSKKCGNNAVFLNEVFADLTSSRDCSGEVLSLTVVVRRLRVFVTHRDTAA